MKFLKYAVKNGPKNIIIIFFNASIAIIIFASDFSFIVFSYNFSINSLTLFTIFPLQISNNSGTDSSIQYPL